jgi:hypothetical protein
MYSFRKRSIFRRPATVFASGLFMLALYPTIGTAALPDACTEAVDVPARSYTMFTLSCDPSPAGLDQQINAEDLGDNAAYGQTWVVYQRPDPSSGWSKMAATDELASGKEYNIYTLTPGTVSVAGDSGGSSGGTGGTATGSSGNARIVFTPDKFTAMDVIQHTDDRVNICQQQADAAVSTYPQLAGRSFIMLERDGHLAARTTPRALKRLTNLSDTTQLVDISGATYRTDGISQWVTDIAYGNMSDKFGGTALPPSLHGTITYTYPVDYAVQGAARYTTPRILPAGERYYVSAHPLTSGVGADYTLGECFKLCEPELSEEAVSGFTFVNCQAPISTWNNEPYYISLRTNIGVSNVSFTNPIPETGGRTSWSSRYGTIEVVPLAGTEGYHPLSTDGTTGPNAGYSKDDWVTALCAEPLYTGTCLELLPEEVTP